MAKENQPIVADENNEIQLRRKRKKVYERTRELMIPEDVIEHFRKENWELRLVRWQLDGKEDLKNLSYREREGYEFVELKELPKWYQARIRVEDTRQRQGVITIEDCCLMKIDTDLRKSRMAYWEKEADKEAEAVSMHVLERKGFKDTGSRSRVVMREPTFSD